MWQLSFGRLRWAGMTVASGWRGGDVLEISAFHATFTQKGYFVSAIVQRTM